MTEPDETAFDAFDKFMIGLLLVMIAIISSSFFIIIFSLPNIWHSIGIVCAIPAFLFLCYKIGNFVVKKLDGN